MNVRKKKLIKSGLQLRLTLVFVSLSWLAALLQVYTINRSILAVTERSAAEGGDLLTYLPDIMGNNLMMTLGIMVPMMVFIGVLATHRIAGPVHRFEEHLGKVLRGEEPGRLTLRRGDELQELCELLNRALEHSSASATTPDQSSSEAA